MTLGREDQMAFIPSGTRVQLLNSGEAVVYCEMLDQPGRYLCMEIPSKDMFYSRPGEIVRVLEYGGETTGNGPDMVSRPQDRKENEMRELEAVRRDEPRKRAWDVVAYKKDGTGGIHSACVLANNRDQAMMAATLALSESLDLSDDTLDNYEVEARPFLSA